MGKIFSNKLAEKASTIKKSFKTCIVGKKEVLLPITRKLIQQLKENGWTINEERNFYLEENRMNKS